MTAGPLAGRRSRVPVILQASRAECGVACLTMVLHSHGHHVPLREVRDVCPAGRDGLSAGGIVRAARQLGMQAAGHPPAAGVLSRLPVPLIAHWEGDHFIVVERFSPRRVRVIEGDVLNLKTLVGAMTGQDVVYANLAGDMKAQAEHIVEAMHTSGLERLIFVSSMGIYGEIGRAHD